MVIRFLRWLGTNVSTLIMAFVLAMVVWTSSTIADDPNQEQLLSRGIKMEVTGKDPELVLMGSLPAEVRVRLNAPRSVWQTLIGDSRSLRAWVDLSGLGAGEHTLEVQVDPNVNPVRVVEIDPAVVNLTLEPLVRRPITVTVQVEGEPAQGYQVGELSVNPGTAVVSGAESLVAQVDRLQVGFSVAGAQQNFAASLPLQILDASGNPVRGVTVSPETVNVALPVTLQGGYRNVIVKFNTIGEVAEGYKLTNISVSPPSVIVFSSDPALVNDLPGYIDSQPLDLTGLTDDVEQQLDLVLPAGVSVVSNQPVIVQVSVAAIESNINLTLPVEIVGLGAGLEAQVAPDTIDLILSGPVPVLNNLRPNSLRVVVDITGMGAGVLEVIPTVSFLPSQVRVQSMLPEKLSVTIQTAPTPTPTMTPSPTPDLTLTPAAP